MILESMAIYYFSGLFIALSYAALNLPDRPHPMTVFYLVALWLPLLILLAYIWVSTFLPEADDV